MVGREAERWEDHILNVAALTGIVLGGGLEREGVLREENEILRVLVAPDLVPLVSASGPKPRAMAPPP